MDHSGNEYNFRFDLRDPINRWPQIIRYFLLGLLFTFILSLVLMFFQTYFGKQQTKIAEAFFFDESPDVIIVFTGDRGRIERAMKFAQKYPSAKLLISGVYSKNTVLSLIKNSGIKFNNDIKIDPISQVIELDYQSQNTLDNVLATLNFLKNNKLLKKVLILSSDYHLFRINLILNYFNKHPNLNIIKYYGVNSSLNFFQRLTTNFKELIKIVQTMIVLIFWNEEVQENFQST